MVEQAGYHGRHRVPALDLVPLDQLKDLARVVAALRQDKRVPDDDGAQQGLHPANVKQRARDQRHVVRGLVDLVGQLARDVQRHLQASQQSPVRQDDCLRLA
ncbi:hypothetical protein D3C72_1670290 [compost metagenome]